MALTRSLQFRVSLLCLLASAGMAAAEEPSSTPKRDDRGPQTKTRVDPPKTQSSQQAELERRLKDLEEAKARLEQEMEALREQQRSANAQLTELLPLKGKVSGYVDFGFFFVQGNGSGIRSDTGHRNFPRYADVPDSWVFMGDPLATTVNSRGEPADTGESRAVTFNPIGNGGAPSFIVNAVNIALFGGLGESLQLNAVLDVVPRGRDVSNPSGLFLGDFIDAKLAYAEYRVPIQRFGLSVFAGKFDSVLGIEYRSQESPDRIGVTPSLICRYTCGRPLGVKARASFLDEALVANLAITNGTHFSEMFPFYNEIAVHAFKTTAGRLSYRFPIGSGFEFGTSGAIGAQDNQKDNDVLQWHYGFDVHLQWRDLDLSAEFVQGRAEGKTAPGELLCATAQCLRYKGAYTQVAYRLTNWLQPYARVDWRNALHQRGASFVYISKLIRATAGLHFELGTSVLVKVEYTAIRELDPIPQFPNDVFTSSLVIKY